MTLIFIPNEEEKARIEKVCYDAAQILCQLHSKQELAYALIILHKSFQRSQKVVALPLD